MFVAFTLVSSGTVYIQSELVASVYSTPTGTVINLTTVGAVAVIESVAEVMDVLRAAGHETYGYVSTDAG